jgi:hypothetical protein
MEWHITICQQSQCALIVCFMAISTLCEVLFKTWVENFLILPCATHMTNYRFNPLVLTVKYNLQITNRLTLEFNDSNCLLIIKVIITNINLALCINMKQLSARDRSRMCLAQTTSSNRCQLLMLRQRSLHVNEWHLSPTPAL